MGLAGSIVARHPVRARFSDPFGLEKPDRKPSFCPICGALVEHGLGIQSQMNYLRQGYVLKPTKPFHAYQCRNLRVCFCDDCVSGEGGVDIICRVLEASSATRTRVEHDCESILNARRKKHRETAIMWGVGLGILAVVIGICCLIWKPEDVFGVIGVIVVLIIVGFIQGAVRR